MSLINFTKVNGAGNDFIVIDYQKNESLTLTPDLINKICHRRKGIGADGILHIKPATSEDFNLTYYNSDGSLGSLCANGSRCAIKYVSENYNCDKKQLSFSCNNQFYSGKYLNTNKVSLNLNEPKDVKLNFPIKYKNMNIIGHCINTGSPHVVFLWDDIEVFFNESFNNFELHNFGKSIRNSKEFFPNGINVNIVFEHKNKLFIRTYERGVEAETLSCGTGTVASAIILHLLKKIKSPIKFITFGNDQMTVDFEVKNDIFSKITLTGPVKINYIGSYNF